MPHFDIILSLLPQTHFCPKLGLFLFANIYRKWPFSETDELTMIFLEFWKIADNRPRSGESLVRALIAARNSPISVTILAISPRRPVLARNLASS